MRIVARARNRIEAVRLREYEIDYIMRETHTLTLLGYEPGESKKIVAEFKRYDIETLGSTIAPLVKS